jgi:hypothetical protein
MQVAEARLMRESEIIALFRRMATHPAARGLVDDAAVWSPPVGRELVLTHDVIVEGVHYLAADNPSDIAWKLVAVNLSDLAAKGALPAGVLVGLASGRRRIGSGSSALRPVSSACFQNSASRSSEAIPRRGAVPRAWG